MHALTIVLMGYILIGIIHSLFTYCLLYSHLSEWLCHRYHCESQLDEVREIFSECPSWWPLLYTFGWFPFDLYAKFAED